MDDIYKRVQGFLGSALSAASSLPSSEDGAFADFATAASPEALSHAASSFSAATSTGRPTPAYRQFSGIAGRPYTKWYRVWERVTIEDFYQELFILPFLLVIIIVSVWGARVNKQRAKQWALAHSSVLRSEFAGVGFGPEILQEKSKNEYTTYCTGRQNVAWLDVRLSLHKRYNPFLWIGEAALSFFMDSAPVPVERIEATAYAFDGKEKSLVPSALPAAPITPANKDSTYDGFVWAIVHKDKMKQLRDDRYDLSLTSTKDHPKLPSWATIMSESAEVTEAMLTPELIVAVKGAERTLESLIVSDQPIDAPKKLDDTVPRKRVYLSMRLDSSNEVSPLFTYFLRMPDHLVTNAHFRAEALRKIKATREEEMRKIRKIDDDEKAEERRLAGEKLKKEERDRKLGSMSADEQKKFLEKEKDKEQRKSMKKRTMRA